MQNTRANIHCHVKGCGAASPGVVIYSVRRGKDVDAYKQWMKALSLNICYSKINACQRHFPAGAPTKNHPSPNPSLFNPIPKNVIKEDPSLSPEMGEIPLFNHSTDGVPLGPDNKPLPSPIEPPPGSTFRLAPHITLIDLKKIKEEQDLDKPFKIEEVTVLIDEQDTVKVVDYDPKMSCNKYRKPAINNWSIWEDCDNESESHEMPDPFLGLFSTLSLGTLLEEMRINQIDCNITLTNIGKSSAVYAHSAVLIAKSPYFYKHIYLKHNNNRLKFRHNSRRITLPFENLDVVDAVISFMYTGCFDVLMNKQRSSVVDVLTFFEMKDIIETYEEEFSKFQNVKIVKNPNLSNVEIINEEMEGDEEEMKVLMFPIIDNYPDSDFEISENVRKKERKHKNRGENFEYAEKGFRDDNCGKMKVSVQKIVNSLNPFFGKIEELFHPSSSSFQNAKTSNQIITLWPANNILLTKLFEQNDLTKYFSDNVSKVLETTSISIPHPDFNNPKEGAGDIVSLFSRTACAIEDLYAKPNIEIIPDHSLDSINVQSMQLINYQPMDISHIPKYVHLIALYHFNICMKGNSKGASIDQRSSSNKNVFLPHFLENDVLQEDSGSAVLEDLVHRILPDDDILAASNIGYSNFQQVSGDLKRKVIADLELYVNPSFHEELIMHIIVDQIDKKNFLPLNLALFLAKGCNFCRKKECKAEDLSLPISPDNPVCPDRLCIKRNLQCNICNKQMSTSKSLARHKYGIHNIHFGDPRGIFICSHCGETFSKKWKLNMHEKQHEDRKTKVTCAYCKKILQGKMALRKHIHMVHETKPRFPCEHCAKVFKRKETLLVHQRIHTGEKPFRCRECDYASETKGNLKVHILRRHKVSLVPLASQNGQAIHQPETQTHSTDDQVMAATIVAHNLPDDVSFILSPGNPSSSLVP